MQVKFIGIHLLITLTVIFLMAILLIILSTFFYLLYKRKRSKQRDDLQRLFYLLIGKVIFNETVISEKGENNKRIIIPRKFQKKLKKRYARQVMKTVILDSKNNLTDAYGENLKILYNQTGLKKDALRNLYFVRRSYLKADAIQELSRMQQADCLRHIYRYVNHKNRYVRMEAESAMINLWGFRGLGFLNFIAYPISEWQQIKLLRQLAHFKYEEFKGIEKWLRSSNDSVVIFALKLVRVYHRFELYDAVKEVLLHPCADVRKNCIITLRNIYREDTALLLIKNYDQEGRDCKLAILDAMSEAGTEEVIPFLMKEIEYGDDEYKLKAANAIMVVKRGEGLQLLKSQPFAGSFPWNEIIVQLKGEEAG